MIGMIVCLYEEKIISQEELFVGKFFDDCTSQKNPEWKFAVRIRNEFGNSTFLIYLNCFECIINIYVYEIICICELSNTSRLNIQGNKKSWEFRYHRLTKIAINSFNVTRIRKVFDSSPTYVYQYVFVYVHTLKTVVRINQKCAAAKFMYI